MLDECSELLVTYRERVTEHWQDLAMQVPVAFPLAGPCEVVIVATLMRYWVFTRLATTDQIRLESHWEDDELDTWKSFQAPLEVVSEHVVSRFLGASPEWQEVEAGNLRGYVLADTYRVFQHLEDPGHVMADEHAGVAQLMDGFESLTGERVVGVARFDGHPPSGALPQKGCPRWRRWHERSLVLGGRSLPSSKPRSWSAASQAALSPMWPGTST